MRRVLRLRRADESQMLYHEEMGADDSPIVFLPGVGGTTRYWKSRVGHLGVDHRLLLVDLLGYGRSPKPWTRYSVERHVEALHRVLRDRGPLTLVGQSFGAIAAVAYAARHPESVARLVLISLPYFGDREHALRYFRNRHSADRFIMTNMVLAAVACIVTRRILGRVLPYLLKDLPREVVEDLVQHTWRSATSTVWEGVYGHDVAEDVAALPPDLPALCIHYDLDKTAPIAGVRRLAAREPNWTLRVLGGADHHPFLRDPAWCQKEIEAFVSGTRAHQAIASV